MKMLAFKKTFVVMLILVMTSALSVHAQKTGQAFADSVATDVSKTTDPLLKMHQLSLLDRIYITINVNKSLDYTTQWLAVARSYKEKKYIALALIALSRCDFILGRNEDVVKCCKEAVAVCEGEAKDLRRPKELALTNLGMGYMNLGNFASAMDYTLQALPIAEDLKDSTIIIVLYTNAGLAFLNQNNLDKAQLHEQQGLAMADKRHDLYGQKKTPENLGHNYLNKNMKPQALADWSRALHLMEDTRDSLGLASDCLCTQG